MRTAPEPHFIDGETEVQRGTVSGLSWLSWGEAEPGFEVRPPPLAAVHSTPTPASGGSDGRTARALRGCAGTTGDPVEAQVNGTQREVA